MNESRVTAQIGNSYVLGEFAPQSEAWDFCATFEADSPVGEIGVGAISQTLWIRDYDDARAEFVQTCKEFLEDDGYAISLMTYAKIHGETHQ